MVKYWNIEWDKYGNTLNYVYTCQDWVMSALSQMELVAKPWAKSVLCDYFGLEIGRDGHAANYTCMYNYY